MKFSLKSLQTQLAIRLAFVVLIVTAAGIGVVLWQGSTTAEEFHSSRLRAQVKELAQAIEPDGRGGIIFNMSERLRHRFRSEQHSRFYAVRLGNGRIYASHPDFAAVIEHWPMAVTAPRYIAVDDFGQQPGDYYAISVLVNTKAGPAMIAVARAYDIDEIGDAVMSDFVHKVAWLVPLFAAVTFAMGVWSIRRGLSAVNAAAKAASAIDPETTGVRLPSNGLPDELIPFVAAVNSAFDRLEKGYIAQRQFTANAAHELRTPLTILIAGLDELDDSPATGKLRHDAARMRRLVEQLLSVARQDAKIGHPADNVDLNEVAEGVVTYLAPWAISRGRSIGFDAALAPVRIKADRAAIEDALRNLIENAVNHTPDNTEVRVAVEENGSLIVEDCGPGIPEADRPHVFERFWRGRGTKAPGAGLGLAIVAEVARNHHAKVDIADRLGGGASVSIRFPKSAS
jgi:signal transduction histidine kinase